MSFTPSPEQQQIIDFPTDRPLRVAAGAGTGKTTTIVLRLQAAIRSGTSPEQALGLTFTNKAAEELSDRLRESLPELAAEGREVEVTTYHGFAYGLLREFGAYVGIERDVRLISPGYVRELIHQELATADEYLHLDLTAPPQRVNETAMLMRQLADNLMTPAELIADPCPETTIEAKRWELAHIAHRVQTMKERLGVVDYGDLVRLVYRVLSEHPAVAARIAARYRMVLLDEYQDTDPAQRRLLTAVFAGGLAVTAVGGQSRRDATRRLPTGLPRGWRMNWLAARIAIFIESHGVLLFWNTSAQSREPATGRKQNVRSKSLGPFAVPSSRG